MKAENRVPDEIFTRVSHRAYADKPLEKAQLDEILRAALASPSAVNRQPWHFSVVTNQTLLQDIHDEVARFMMAREESSRSPRFADPAFQVFYHAPLVIFISGEQDFSWTEVDCGIAVQNIALAAEGLGLGSVILGMPKAAFEGARGEEFARALDFPEGHRFVIAIAIGTPADTKDAHPVKEGHISLID